MNDGRRVLGTIPEPGHYERRSRKGAPRQALRIIHSPDTGWVVLLNGEAVTGSGAADWVDVPLLLRWPFNPISPEAYYALLQERELDTETPLDERVDLRKSRSLF